MDGADVAFAGIAVQADLLRRRELSSRDLVNLYLERIERIDPHLNAFRVVRPDAALDAADAADARRAHGEDLALLGVPVAVKDGWDVRGELTTHGTGAVDRPAVDDAEFVTRLRRAGAIVIGKTTQPELAIWMFTESEAWGKTRNPWNLDHIPGGSSGGSGAAVAAGLVGAASGSDGGGSIRLPATACGLFGLKPQRGRVPLTPHVGHWHGLTAAGCLTRTVADTALWLDIVAGPSPHDSDTLPTMSEPLQAAAQRSPGRLRVAVSLRSATGEEPTGEIVDAVEATAAMLTGLGHRVHADDPDYAIPAEGVSDLMANYRARYLRGISDDHQALDHPDQAMQLTRDIAAAGAGIDDNTLAGIRAGEAVIAARLADVFDRADVVLSPVVSHQPFLVGEHDERDARAWAVAGWRDFGGAAYLTAWNVTGQPAASLPSGFDTDGVPLGVQLVGRPGDEATLLALAAQLEKARPWAQQRPPLP